MVDIHPEVDNGINPTKEKFNGGVLKCHCQANQVTVNITAQCAHTHVCGCSQCWKPDAALFSLIAVIPTNNLEVISNNSKLQISNKNAVIKRFVCQECGVHMYGRIDNSSHPFFGLDFIHIELSKERGWLAPNFAAFVSSIIETGTNPKDMPIIRKQLKALGLEPYDCLSPELMDIIATSVAKNK